MNDEPIQEIRTTRHRISEEFGHNPQKYIDYLKNQSVRYSRQTELYRKLPEHMKETEIRDDPPSEPAEDGHLKLRKLKAEKLRPQKGV
ncbi:MAG: hypothetical protein GY795_39510 [Desulfobacterales bacterium]|nr:hypothetical protein [Desulfobacterales bacterium]